MLHIIRVEGEQWVTIRVETCWGFGCDRSEDQTKVKENHHRSLLQHPFAHLSSAVSHPIGHEWPPCRLMGGGDRLMGGGVTNMGPQSPSVAPPVPKRHGSPSPPGRQSPSMPVSQRWSPASKCTTGGTWDRIRAQMRSAWGGGTRSPQCGGRGSEVGGAPAGGLRLPCGG